MSEVRWRQDAACRGFDQEVFFPSGSKRQREKQERIAKAICGVCDVQAECLAEAVATQEGLGVWGGLSPEERGLTMDGRGTVKVIDRQLAEVR